MPSTSTKRLQRLAGDGKNRGGGLPLPPLFHTIAAELLDRGESTVEDLIRPVEQVITKPERVAELYPDDGYTGLVTDGLEQLAAAKFVETVDGHWTLTEKFHARIGKPITVLSRRKPVPTSIKIVVYPKAERERLSQAATQGRELRAMYNDMHNERVFEVQIIGPQGGRTKRLLRLHPLARVIPRMDVDDFLNFAQDIRERGVRQPLTLFDGQVLDGRHRLAAASALGVPVHVQEFTGDRDAALDEAISLNFVRRQLTTAQRALVVQQVFLPRAEREAKERLLEGNAAGGRADGSLPPIGGRLPRGRNAMQIAAESSNGLATARTLERMEPVRAASRTQEKILRGEITSALAARRSAIEELGLDAPADVPGTFPMTAYTALGQALGRITKANDALRDGKPGDATVEQMVERIADLRAALDETTRLIEERHEQGLAPDEATV